MLQTKLFTLGKLSGTIYDFPEIDDILPMHEHTEENVHITVVARGKFKAIGEGWEKELSAGDVVDWVPYQKHEFISLEKNSRIVNIIK
jgi:hypothetical protein